MIEVPDISHLTPEEQQKILLVLKRQQDEEEKEKHMLKTLHEQFEDYKSHIKTVAEESKISTPPDDKDPVCSLCFKTKFADGCGHICTFCEIRFCSRCGGRITIRSNKTMWVCNLCRKQKELLSKSGAWYHGGNIKLKHSNDMREKENIDTQKFDSKSLHEEISSKDASSTLLPLMQLSSDISNVQPSPVKRTDIAIEKTKSVQDSQTNETNKNRSTVPHIVSTSTLPQNEIKLVSKVEQNDTGTKFSQKKSVNNQLLRNSRSQTLSRPDKKSATMHINERVLKSGDLNGKLISATLPQSNEHTRHIYEKNPSRGDNNHASNNRKRNQTTLDLKHNSYSNISNANERKYQKHRLKGCQSEPNLPECCTSSECSLSGSYRKQFYRQHDRRKDPSICNVSVSSSEEDMRSCTEYSSFDDGEKETSISDYEFLHLQQMRDQPNENFHRACHHPLEHYLESLNKSSTSLCSCRRNSGNTRDSGVESSSVLCHDISQEQLPVSWQPSSDGKFLIGHLLLYKNISSTSHMARRAGALLGLKVVGGKTTPSGRLGAFVTKVKKGSLADTIGHLKPGDEIISWNKYCLQDTTFDEVYEIVLESKADSMVELVVSRPIRDVPRIPETRHHQTAESSSCSLDSERRDFEHSLVRPLQGKIQIKIWYEEKSQQLYVTALRAVDLLMREGGLPRNPYLKMYLLPDRSNSFKRRTKTAKKTLAPEWMQAFVYSDVRRDDLGAMALELTLWDFDRSLEANNKFMGEVIVDLGLVCLNDEPHWFHLMPLGYGMDQDYASETYPVRTSYSDANFAQVGTENFAMPKSTSYNGGTGSHLSNVDKSSRALHKRRLPHLPTTNSLSTLACDDSKSSGKSSPVIAEVRQRESDVVDSSSSSKPSMTFDTVSVDHTLQTFVGGVGPGQIVGRQALAMSSVGELELGFYRRQGQLVVQVKQGRKLAGRQGSRVKPGYYVKIYMMSGVQCIAKKKTKLSTKSCSPHFNEGLLFDSNSVGNALQVIVWADYGRMDSKVFTGSAQISLENLDLAGRVSGWYKLFPSSSIIEAASYGMQDSNSSFGSSSQILS